MSKTPIEMMFDGVQWTATPENAPQDAHDGPGIPYATHSGIWDFMGQQIRVYRLSTGQAVIHGDDLPKIFGMDA